MRGKGLKGRGIGECPGNGRGCPVCGQLSGFYGVDIDTLCIAR
jgi:hypothetical protein